MIAIMRSILTFLPSPSPTRAGVVAHSAAPASGWSDAERAEVLDGASRAFGAALMDTLITSDRDALEIQEEVNR